MNKNQIVVALIFTVAACSGPAKNTRPLLDLIQSKDGKVDYIISLKNVSDAKDHESALKGRALIAHLDASGRTLRVQADARELGALQINEDALVHENTPVRVIAPQQLRNTPGQAVEVDPQDLFMARKVVGVDALAARKPEADGRALKVAIFDTGIDFGVEGIERHPDGRQKLVGFYDLTGFGKVQATLLDNDALQESYTIEGRSVRFVGSALPQRIQSTGNLSELQMAKNYSLASGVDVNANNLVEDNFPYAVGVNHAGVAAVWIDLNMDGSLDLVTEELTDYNTSYKYINTFTGTPSGARPLAVTITSSTELQFHTVPEGHGTGCASIVAGENFANGRLIGMAPAADLMSYTLDASGQDIYNLDQFLGIFLHARDHGANLISISWGFATADLSSARFVADFLDREIAAAGVVIAIAAGNEGPGFSSAGPTDYIPHHGFGVGAYVSKDQARNLYGWTGTIEDTMVWYSSFGPTKGGRLIPDISAPLMSLVRDARGTSGPQFYPFSGTSSATPAFVGATTSLISALRSDGITNIDVPLLKLALQNSAKALKTIEAIRQGPGLVDVNAAYDLYLRLAAEKTAARADATRRGRFAVELRASTPAGIEGVRGEGIHVYGFTPNAEVYVSMTAASRELIDPLVFVEPLRISFNENFLRGPDMLLIQATDSRFSVEFDASKLSKPGIYTDVITLSRQSDGLVILRVPVVIEIPHVATESVLLTQVEKTLKPFDIVRYPLRLSEAGTLHFEGLVQDLSPGRGSSLGVFVTSADGLHVFEKFIRVERASQQINVRTEKLPAGNYEMIFFRNFSRAAVLNRLRLQGTLRESYLNLLAAELRGTTPSLAVRARGDISVAQAEFEIQGKRITTQLLKDDTAGPAFVGELNLGTETRSMMVGLEQSDFDRSLDSLFNVEMILRSPEGMPLYRGWVNVQEKNSPPTAAVDLTAPAQSLRVTAYPNIVKWNLIDTRELRLVANSPLDEAVKVAATVSRPSVTRGETLRIDLLLGAEHSLSPGQYGVLRLYDVDHQLIEELPALF